MDIKLWDVFGRYKRQGQSERLLLSDALPIALDLVYTSNLQSTEEQEQQQKYIEAVCVNAGLSAATYPSITANTDTSTRHQFIDTPASLKQLQKISVAAQSKRMVVVCGDECSGKTSLVVELARRTGRNLVVLPIEIFKINTFLASLNINFYFLCYI